jgi:hypothetical protein
MKARRDFFRCLRFGGLWLLIAWMPASLHAQAPASGGGLAAREQQALAQPYQGIVTSDGVRSDLFPIRSTGVSTEPVQKAAETFLAAFTPEQRAASTFPVDDTEWRKWANQHRYTRQGVAFRDMTDRQRELAFDLMRAGLSAKGLEISRNIMRLNETLAEMVDNFDEYGEWLYWITVMGTPSQTEPWGWQLDGHHLVINYFVLGDQVVMTPTFMGSEPVIARTGKYAGTQILEEEEAAGRALFVSLEGAQRSKALIGSDKTRNNTIGEAFNDNLTLDYAGIPGRDLTPAQKEKLLDVIEVFVSNMDDGHARVKMEEVREHLDETYFAWIGGSDEDSVFYYRVHSPVILIEFDHQLPVALPLPRVPGREHIHTVVRTPNGNDYGKDLLRQHYEESHSSD